MVSAPFEYTRVVSYDEAVQALCDHDEDAKLLAGGQSLVPMLNLRLVRPTVLIDINAADTREPYLDSGRLVLPALTRHAQLLAAPAVRCNAPLLSAAARYIGNVRVRNRGTLGGSLAHADPTGELSCAALALDASVIVRGPRGEREIAVADLFDGYLTTRLEQDDVITEMRVPVGLPERGARGWSFQEVARRASDFAVVAAAACVEVDPGRGAVRHARVGLAGVADRVIPAEPAAIGSIVGTVPTDAALADVARAAAEATSPETDVHASGAYRRRLVAVLTRRALAEAIGRAHDTLAAA
ncbi:MAG TPA: FAD binding domain-containing protein [Streptosporangiaceae bacterium]|nr:FAD binding domain-containing protein [Streptosporangiaceae bacterium]